MSQRGITAPLLPVSESIVAFFGTAEKDCYTTLTTNRFALEIPPIDLSRHSQAVSHPSIPPSFREGKEKLLITTNLCARGIDVEQVTIVINFDIPMDVHHRADVETYLHRIGRTGRFGRKGLAINFVDGRRSRDHLKKIEEHFGRPIVKLDLEDFDLIEKALSDWT